ncbi:hypothetical protein LOTGIDRAFT_108855 [Lottia gigantea]|uniref:G-protein coupled receptors family 1 profile domain-containing protein n=1 Tax=Lottia gigantea TaxID=225164 RepID=V3ZEV7_LOTGI|nr:hypothetical protein LOTGIDRAFT_108855 [Lottia gigantea]ESO82637.1 hypothetical protein LOTGIDRAFT_108855 [Lottia gigantea]
MEALLIAAYCLVISSGIFGNVLVCIVIFRNTELRSSRNLLILNLSVCDIFMDLVCMPLSLVRLTLKNWPLGEFLCRIIPSMQTVDVFVSTFTILAIAIDRYHAIVRASREKRKSRKNIYVIVGIWIVSLLFSTPMLLFHQVETVDVMDFTMCVENWPNTAFRGTFGVIVMVVQYLSPTLVISCLHARICHFLHARIEENPVTLTEMNRAVRDMRRHRRNLFLLTAITITFASTWLPLTVLNIAADFDHNFFDEKHFNLVFAWCLLLAMGSSSLNPIFYGWFNLNFRKGFYALLCFGIPDNEQSERSSLNSREKRSQSAMYDSIRSNQSHKSNSSK